MQLSPNGVELIKHFEGCKLTAYRCSADVWTIGYGSTGPHVYEGLSITEEYAEELLRDDLLRFESGVLSAVTVPINQDQYDALVSFAFNVGLGNLKSSTLLRKLNSRNYVGAGNEFQRWNRAKGRVLNGLTRRRHAESRLFQGLDWR